MFTEFPPRHEGQCGRNIKALVWIFITWGWRLMLWVIRGRGWDLIGASEGRGTAVAEQERDSAIRVNSLDFSVCIRHGSTELRLWLSVSLCYHFSSVWPSAAVQSRTISEVLLSWASAVSGHAAHPTLCTLSCLHLFWLQETCSVYLYKDIYP